VLRRPNVLLIGAKGEKTEKGTLTSDEEVKREMLETITFLDAQGALELGEDS